MTVKKVMIYFDMRRDIENKMYYEFMTLVLSKLKSVSFKYIVSVTTILNTMYINNEY